MLILILKYLTISYYLIGGIFIWILSNGILLIKENGHMKSTLEISFKRTILHTQETKVSYLVLQKEL